MERDPGSLRTAGSVGGPAPLPSPHVNFAGLTGVMLLDSRHHVRSPPTLPRRASGRASG